MKNQLVSLLAVVLGVMISISMMDDVSAQESASGAVLQGVKAEQESYPLDESVRFTYAIRNRSDSPITYNFSSSKHFDLWITCGSKEVYRHSKGKMYTMALTSLTLQPGETKEYSVEWNQKDNSDKDVGPGVYEISARLTPTSNQPPAAKAKVKLGSTSLAVVPVTVAEAIRRSDELLGRRVQIRATYKGWQPNSGDSNTRLGPPVSRNDWAICDSTGCMYVNGAVDLDPAKDAGVMVNVVGKLQKTDKGQVYIVLETVTVEKPG